MKKTYIVLLLLLLLASCNKYEPLLLPKTPYEGNELRTDGFWYHIRYSQNEGLPDRMNVHFLYRDGTFLRATTVDTTDPCEITIDDVPYQSPNYNKQTKWGVFVVENGVLQWSKWVWQSMGSGQAYLTTFEIINDTCFKREGVEEYYYFYPFDCKPDSTVARQWIQ